MATIQLRRGDASAWTDANSVLAAGEVGLEMDTGKFKFGDGTTAWNDLAYIGGGSFPPDGWVVNTDGDGQLRLVTTADTALAIVNGNESAITQFQDGDAIITFEAIASGLDGEQISVVLQSLADDEDLSISVDGNAISVVLEAVSGEITSTAQDVADIVNGDTDASALVGASVLNDGVLGGHSAQFLSLPVGLTVGAGGDVEASSLTVVIDQMHVSINGDGVAFSIAGETSENDLFRASAGDGGAWGLTKHGLEYFQAFDAGVDDGDVGNGERMQWMDDTSGDPAFRFKMRDVDGNLHTGRSVGLGDDGVIKLANLPTSDPAVADELWNDAGVLKVSAG